MEKPSEREDIIPGPDDKAPRMKRRKGVAQTKHIFMAPKCPRKRTQKKITQCTRPPFHEGSHKDKFGNEW